ncbi:MAG: hypothetical protein IPK26_02820 [Planctomycetes bacterium]|nr:hypothetical protein [Planctomycetota bacterium]
MNPVRNSSCKAHLASAAALVLGVLSPVVAQGGLPPLQVPPQNPITPQKSILGKLLFWEEQMSADNRVACGTCHTFAAGGGDLRRVVHPGPDNIVPSPDDTFGSPGVIRSDASNDYLPSTQFGLNPQVTPRSSPSFLFGAWFPENFWDGRARGTFVNPETGQVSIPAGGALENQAVGPILNAVEMAHDARTWAQVSGKLANVRPMALATNLPADMAAAIAGGTTYPQLFEAAFGSPGITAERIGFALATYERTLVADQAPWDQFQRGNPQALTPQQVNGMNIFNGPGRCNLCHTPGLFSDRQFRNLGLRRIQDDIGRQAVTGNPLDGGKFKVPSLRNVGLRTQFMHTGQFTNLGQVIGFYNGGGGPNQQNKDPLLRPLNLGPQQRGDLQNFVANGLTDPRVRDGVPPFDRPTLASQRIPPAGFLFGPGTPGSGNRMPAMLAGVPANVGNAEFKIGVGNAVGGTAALLAVAMNRAPVGSQINGVNINVDVWTGALLNTVIHGATGVAGAGYGTVRAGLPVDPSLAGMTAFVQWIVWDSGVPSGASSSQGADIRFF